MPNLTNIKFEITVGDGRLSNKEYEWCNFNTYYLNKRIYSSEGLMGGDEE